MTYPTMESVVALLGHRGRDRITEVTGVITSVNFDLYGCVQACLHRGVDKDGKQLETFWYDVQRIEILTLVRVMEPPAFGDVPAARYDNGAAEKPPYGAA